MIFVTIGSMFPFDRLIRAMDDWAAAQPEPVELVAQIGEGSYRPAHMRWVPSLARAIAAAEAGSPLPQLAAAKSRIAEIDAAPDGKG